MYFIYHTLILILNLMMEERQIKDISTLLPPLPPRPKGSILPLPVPKKIHSSNKTTKSTW